MCKVQVQIVKQQNTVIGTITVDPGDTSPGGAYVARCTQRTRRDSTGYCVQSFCDSLPLISPEPVTRCVETEDELCSPSYPVAGTEPIRCCYGGSKSDGSKWTPSEDCYGGPARIAEAPHDLDYNVSFIADIKEGGLRQTITLPSLREYK